MDFPEQLYQVDARDIATGLAVIRRGFRFQNTVAAATLGGALTASPGRLNEVFVVTNMVMLLTATDVTTSINPLGIEIRSELGASLELICAEANTQGAGAYNSRHLNWTGQLYLFPNENLAGFYNNSGAVGNVSQTFSLRGHAIPRANIQQG